MPELNNTILKNSANLKAYFRFESGAETTDSSGSGYTLTANGTPTYGTGKFGNAVTVSSNNQLYRNSTTDLDMTTGAISYGCWFKTNTGQNDVPVLGKLLETGSFPGYELYLNTGAVSVLMISAAGTDIATYTVAYADGLWHHAVCTRPASGGLIKIYFDGQCAATATNNNRNLTNTAKFSIGARNVSNNDFAGSIDEAFVFDIELSADQIKELYEGRYVGEGWPQTGLVAGYHLSSTTDFSGNNYHLTNNGTVTFAAAKFGNGADMGNPNTTKYLSYAGNLGIAGSGDMTVSMWIKLAALPSPGNFWGIFSHFSTLTTDRYWRPYYLNTAGTYTINVEASGGTAAVYTGNLGTTAWHHLVFTRASNVTGFYLDGNLAASGTSGTGTAAQNYFQLGAYSGTPMMPGLVDETQVYNVLKDARWVRQQYALGVGKFY